MATFALIHGGGSTAWDWHLVAPLLEQAGHDVVAVDRPIEDENALLEDHVAAVTTAVGSREQVIVVGHSLGGITAPLAAAALHADGLVYLSGMIPLPGETFGDWWTNTGHDRENVSDDPTVSFFTGVPDDLARAARAHERDQQGKWMSRPWPAERHPSIPTCAILCRDDRFFPAAFMARQIRDRLGIEPVDIPGGHYAVLSEPAAVAGALIDFARDIR
ncbi:alpha/beta hydrolase [Cryobacterium melibiosiphilum]|uniref:Alpha/beta hydrolase n=1 Tax=Cryobacterium melibiosiphilum TaxID=995039 RepID=A0A3A5MKY6_9MICO|nr:alpha/beta hydrolase [Cryobacterium melibiosiphilum]RJT87513.1 alpha/beta hydrolase [Cryobacterium melibiosiphilum]